MPDNEELEEPLTNEEISQMSIMMMKAFGSDRDAANQIAAWSEALRGEAPIPTISEEGAPDVMAFGVPMQVFSNREDAWRDLSNLAETVKKYPGAEVGGKEFIKAVFPDIDESSVDVWWGTPGFSEYLKTKEPGNQDITVFIDAMLKTVNEVQLEAAIEEQKSAAEKVAYHVTAGVPFPEGEVAVYPLGEALPDLTSKDEAYSRLGNAAARLNTANQDVSWAITGALDTYLGTGANQMIGSVTRRELDLGAWEDSAIQDLMTQGSNAVQSGMADGFVALPARRVAEFYDIVTTHPNLGMNLYRQLDLLRSIPQTYALQESNDLASFVLSRSMGARGDWLSSLTTNQGINLVNTIDKALSEAALQEIKRGQQFQAMYGKQVEQRLGFPTQAITKTTDYGIRMSDAIGWYLRKNVESALFPGEKQYVPESMALTGERAGALRTMPLSALQKDQVPIQAIKALFPPERWGGIPRRKRGVVEEQVTEEERLRRGEFPALVYRVPEW